MGPQAKTEYLARMRDRYVRAKTGREKGRLLTEAMAVTGHHRKALIRAWRRPEPVDARRRGRRGRARRYGPAAVRALKAIWTVAGYPWSVRLKALLPLWLPWARKRLSLSKAVEAQVRTISARQIDRVLAPDKRRIRRRMYGRTKPGTLLKHHIPIKTDHWDVTEPGFTEVDLVSHSGERADGDFLHSLDMTDIHTTWVETGAVMGKSQVRVQEALEQLRQQLPFRAAGHRFGQRLGIHQRASARVLSGPADSIHARAALQERRQRAHRAEELDARAQAHGLSPLRHGGGARRDERGLCRPPAAAESLFAVGETAIEGARRGATPTALRRAANPAGSGASLSSGRSRQSRTRSSRSGLGSTRSPWRPASKTSSNGSTPWRLARGSQPMTQVGGEKPGAKTAPAFSPPPLKIKTPRPPVTPFMARRSAVG